MRVRDAVEGVLLVSLVLLAACAAPAHAGCPYKRGASFGGVRAAGTTALSELNAQLQSYYEDNKALLLAQQHAAAPVVYVSDSLTLQLPSGAQYKESVTPDLYTQLKLVSHTSLAAFVMLYPCMEGNGSVGAITASQLQRYLSVLPSAIGEVATLPLTQDQQRRAVTLMTATRDLLAGVLTTGKCASDVIGKYLQSAVPIIQQNVNDSVIAQLDATHALMMKWKAEYIPAEQWDQLRVVILSAHMPRQMNLFLQYFTRLLHTELYTGLRVVYAEGLSTLADADDLLSTHLMDFAVGQGFFGDPEHMHYDLLAWAAQDYLQHLLPGNAL